MRRSTITWVVDLAAFVGVVLLVATGFLMRYALPAGSGGLHGLGTGPRAAARPIALILGLTRHEWGEVHFWIAVGVMGILALHLLMHWRWIVYVLRGEPTNAAGWRIALGIIGLLGLLAIVVVPLLIPRSTNRVRSLRDSVAVPMPFPTDRRPAHSREDGLDQRPGPECSMKSREQADGRALFHHFINES